MVNSCFVDGCNSKYFKDEDRNITFHKFPSDPVIAKQWESALQILNQQDNFKERRKHSVICSKHFTENCFYTTGPSSWKLIGGSVPSHFPKGGMINFQTGYSATHIAVNARSEKLTNISDPSTMNISLSTLTPDISLPLQNNYQPIVNHQIEHQQMENPEQKREHTLMGKRLEKLTPEQQKELQLKTTKHYVTSSISSEIASKEIIAVSRNNKKEKMRNFRRKNQFYTTSPSPSPPPPSISSTGSNLVRILKKELTSKNEYARKLQGISNRQKIEIETLEVLLKNIISSDQWESLEHECVVGNINEIKVSEDEDGDCLEGHHFDKLQSIKLIPSFVDDADDKKSKSVVKKHSGTLITNWTENNEKESDSDENNDYDYNGDNENFHNESDDDNDEDNEDYDSDELMDENKSNIKTKLIRLSEKEVGKKYLSPKETKGNHPKLKRKRICPICNKFVAYTALSQHINTHTGSRNHLCSICGKSFTTKHTLKKHNLSSHSEESPFPCQLCDKKYRNATTLKEHMRKHNNEKYKCNICGRELSHYSGLATHMKFHKGQRDYECQICGKKFFTLGNRKNHMRTHLRENTPHHSEPGNRTYKREKSKHAQCSVCQKTFSSPQVLKSHELLHSGERPFLCERCPKAYPSASALKKHVSMMHDQDPSGVDYECCICGEMFEQNHFLIKHVRRTHSKERPFKCRYCGKCFNYHSNLLIHFRMHNVKSKRAVTRQDTSSETETVN